MDVGQTLRFRLIGYAPIDRVDRRRTHDLCHPGEVGRQPRCGRRDGARPDRVAARASAPSQQTVQGADIAATQRENFINALQGRVAGVDVTSTSGAPGASTSITIRGVSSISSSNQPLMIVDGLPIDNKTTQHGQPGLRSRRRRRSPSAIATSTSRTARPTSIPKTSSRITVLKGPEAVGAVRHRCGERRDRHHHEARHVGRRRVRVQQQLPRRCRCAHKPDIQNDLRSERHDSATPAERLRTCTSAPRIPPARRSTTTSATSSRPAVTQKHNLSFSGGDGRQPAELSHLGVRRPSRCGVIPNIGLNKINLTGTSQGAGDALAECRSVDDVLLREQRHSRSRATTARSSACWCGRDTNNARELPHAGRQRAPHHGARRGERRSTTRTSRSTRTRATTRRTASSSTPGSLSCRSRGATCRRTSGPTRYTNQNLILRHPESVDGANDNGILDINDDITRNINAQTLFNVNDHELGKGLSISGLVGNPIHRSEVDRRRRRGHQLPRSEFRLDQQHVDTSRTARSSRSAAW